MRMRVGIDFGGVLQRAKGHDTNADVADLPLLDGAVEATKTLVDTLGQENVFIVSKASGSTKAGTIKCLESNKFYERTSFLESNVHFTTNRNGSKGKWPVASKLHLTAFVDDNWSLFADPLLEDENCCGGGGRSGHGGAMLCLLFGDAPAAADAEPEKLDRDSDDKKAPSATKPLRCGGGKDPNGTYEQRHTLADVERTRDLRRVANWTDATRILLEAAASSATTDAASQPSIPRADSVCAGPNVAEGTTDCCEEDGTRLAARKCQANGYAQELVAGGGARHCPTSLIVARVGMR